MDEIGSFKDAPLIGPNDAKTQLDLIPRDAEPPVRRIRRQLCGLPRQHRSSRADVRSGRDAGEQRISRVPYAFVQDVASTWEQYEPGGAAECGDGGCKPLGSETLPGLLALPDIDDAKASSVGPATCRISPSGGC